MIMDVVVCTVGDSERPARPFKTAQVSPCTLMFLETSLCTYNCISFANHHVIDRAGARESDTKWGSHLWSNGICRYRYNNEVSASARIFSFEEKREFGF